MTTRREFITQTIVSSIAGTTFPRIGNSMGDRLLTSPSVAPRKGARIKSVIRREETILRLGGYGDCYHMSWAADDRQYCSVCDGLGWSDEPTGGWLYNSRLWAIQGSPREANFHPVSGYPLYTPPPFGEHQRPRYYSLGTLALDGRMYQFLGTGSDSSSEPDVHYIGAKLIYSPDAGRTWCNQDGSTPVTWESWEQRSRKTMVFFQEPQDAFSVLSVLQMGKNYGYNRDGYIYVYAPNGSVDGTINELVMFRVPNANILNRNAYEYFAGLRSDGSGVWVKNIMARAVVHTFPQGLTGKSPFAWIPSVTYNAPLGLYMMANWGWDWNSAGDDKASKPSYLGFWVASKPWGPWEQIHEETAWLPGNDPNSSAYSPQIAPKWIAADGKSFWLVWADYQRKQDVAPLSELYAIAGKPVATVDDLARAIVLQRQLMPYYAFNVQRVDLVVG